MLAKISTDEDVEQEKLEIFLEILLEELENTKHFFKYAEMALILVKKGKISADGIVSLDFISSFLSKIRSSSSVLTPSIFKIFQAHISNHFNGSDSQKLKKIFLGVLNLYTEEELLPLLSQNNHNFLTLFICDIMTLWKQKGVEFTKNENSELLNSKAREGMELRMALAQNGKISNKHWMIIAKIMVDELNSQNGGQSPDNLGFSVKISDFEIEIEEKYTKFEERASQVCIIQTNSETAYHPQKDTLEAKITPDDQVYINEILFAFQSDAPKSDLKAIYLILSSQNFTNLEQQAGKSYIPQLT